MSGISYVFGAIGSMTFAGFVRGSRSYGMSDTLVLTRRELRTPDGSIPIQKIGEGMFSTAYRRIDTPDRVFVVPRQGAYDKEILEMARDQEPGNPHLPDISRFGWTEEETVYEMPWYKAPLRKADSARAWSDYLLLKACWDEAWKSAPYGKYRSGYEHNERLYACAESSELRPSLLTAIRALIDTASNFGEDVILEITPRNLATNHEGNLVLLDPTFDMRARDKAFQQRRRAKERRDLQRRMR